MKIEPRKIAFLLPSLKFGGAERVALNLALAFKQQGIQIDFLLMSKEGEFLAEAQFHFKVYDLQCNKTYKLPKKLSQYLEIHSPDALISSFWKLNLCAVLARLLHPTVKLLLWEHSQPSKSKNSPTWLYAISASVLYQLSTKVVVVSNGVLKDISNITIGLQHKLMVIFNPIAPPINKISNKLNQSKTNRIAWVGRLDNPKNPMLMLEAFALITKSYDATLTYVGEGKLRDELEKRTADLHLQDCVHFAGFLDDPYTVLTESDLLALSSDREGFGNVLVEAMYCGLRLVSTNSGLGIKDILLNEELGAIVPIKDHIALAEAINQKLAGVHDASRQKVSAQRFLPNTIALQFLDALK